MGFPWRKIISLRKLVSDLRPIDILTGEIAIEVTGVVEVSPALWYFRYIVSIFLTLHKCLCYNWKFANFWLEIWSRNEIFYRRMWCCFYCLLMFSFCLFKYWTNCIPFQYILFTFLSCEWRIKTVFIIYS